MRDEVLAGTATRQEPYVTSSLGGSTVSLIRRGCSRAARASAPPAAAGRGRGPGGWAAAKDSTSIAVLEAFRRQYGSANAFYDRLAEARIEALRQQQTADMLKAEPDRKRAEEERKRAEADLLRPGRVFRDCADGCPEMVVLPAGEFTMGSNEHDSEKPPHRVVIQRPFAVGKFEVTFAEWDACVAEGRLATTGPSDQGWGKGRRPVIHVSWDDAKEYAGWLSRKTGKSYRLLSEAEWEYAARAGTTTRYALGDTITQGPGSVCCGQDS